MLCGGLGVILIPLDTDSAFHRSNPMSSPSAFWFYSTVSHIEALWFNGRQQWFQRGQILNTFVVDSWAEQTYNRTSKRRVHLYPAILARSSLEVKQQQTGAGGRNVKDVVSSHPLLESLGREDPHSDGRAGHGLHLLEPLGVEERALPR